MRSFARLRQLILLTSSRVLLGWLDEPYATPLIPEPQQLKLVLW